MRRLRLAHQPGKPLALDLFSGAGGAGMGFWQAGFNVVGVDKYPQRNYPFEHYVADAVTFLENVISDGNKLPDGRPVRAVNASPPCQRWSLMTNCRPGLAVKYPDLIAPTRPLLQAAGLPWVMENVIGAPLLDPIILCGAMFGLELYRHRQFESNIAVPQPDHVAHTKPASRAGHWVPGTIMSVSGHIAPIAVARQVMEITWTNRGELAEAIPPPYTHYVASHLMRQI